MSEVTASLKVRVSAPDAHYGGGLVSGAAIVALWHDVATELSIRNDGDEGLFAGYSSIEFLQPVRAGDFIEATGKIVRVGNTSREMSFEALRYARATPGLSDSAATIVEPPEVVAKATGTCVVRKGQQRR